MNVSNLTPGVEQLINDSDFSNCTTNGYTVSIPSNSIFIAFQLQNNQQLLRIMYCQNFNNAYNTTLNGSDNNIKFIKITGITNMVKLLLGNFDPDVEPSGKFTPFISLTDDPSENGYSSEYYDSSVYRCTELFSYS